MLLLLLLAPGLLSTGAFAQTTSGAEEPFAIQVNASPEAALISAQLDSLHRRGLPAYRTQTTSDGGVTYHRLRLGPFPSRAAAERFARCRGRAEAWLVPAASDSAAFGRVVTDMAADVVPLRPRPPRYLLGRRHAVAALLVPAYGDRAAAQPATMRVYAPGRREPVVVERVTGVREEDGALEYGHAARVFVKEPGEATADYADAIEDFSRQQSLSKYLVEDYLALYDGGRVARFTLLGRLPLRAGGSSALGTPETLRQPGFDYVDAEGRAVRHHGAVGEEQAQRVGNARDRSLQRDGPTQGATRRVALFARPTERGDNAQVCLLFFEE